MLNAIIENKNGDTANIDLTTHYFELYKELQAVGYCASPQRLKLKDEDEEEYRVKLYSDSSIGNQMILLLNERNSLYDAYLLDLAVINARDEIKDDLEQNILNGQYANFSEVLEDINEMKMQAASSKLSFYCPLVASLDEGEDYYPASSYYIIDNRDGIEEMLKNEQTPDLGDMAEYLGNHSGIGEKIIHAVWNVDEIDGELYGRIDCYLSTDLNSEETEKLRSAVCGQNSDGFGESFEQRPIKTEDGDLYVSFWNSGNDYFVYTKSEMDEYVENKHGMQLGGM